MAENAVYQTIDKQLGYAWNTLYHLRERIDPKGDGRELATAEEGSHGKDYSKCRCAAGANANRDPVKSFRRVRGHDTNPFRG